MTLLQKIKAYFFHICPCGGKVETWNYGKWYCPKCMTKYGEWAKDRKQV